MNKFKSSLALALTVAVLAGCKQETQGLARATDAPETDLQKQSYALGANMSNSLMQANIEIDSGYFNAGFYDTQDGTQMMTVEDMQAALMAMQQAAAERQAQERAAAIETNLAAANEALAANAKLEGVVSTESGLQYKVETTGEGATPTASDTVTVHYEGRLVDGTVFDSSIQRGEPATFPVNGVIPGWTEALQLMTVGSKWQLTIPPDLAYGENGAGAIIPPNSALIFDVELIGIEAAEEEGAAADAG